MISVKERTNVVIVIWQERREGFRLIHILRHDSSALLFTVCLLFSKFWGLQKIRSPAEKKNGANLGAKPPTNIIFQDTNDVIIHHAPIKPITPNEITRRCHRRGKSVLVSSAMSVLGPKGRNAGIYLVPCFVRNWSIIK
jgi:hypothetical protein